MLLYEPSAEVLIRVLQDFSAMTAAMSSPGRTGTRIGRLVGAAGRNMCKI